MMIHESPTLDHRFLDDLYLFYRYYVARVKYKTKSVPAHHIKELSRHLMALKLGVLDKHLAVSMPPRHSKSSMITLAFPLWLIFENHDLNILIVSNTKELAEKFGIDLRELITQFGPQFDVYLSDVKHSSTHLKFCDKDGNLYNGSIRLTGASGSITGQDADWLIIDDPYKGEEDEFTPTALQKKIDWFNRVIEQRLEPHTKLLILHTRWHSRDIIGYLQEEQPDDYKFITYKAISNDNKPLWPEKYTLEDYLKKLRKVKERLFSAIWQQEPLDETSDFFDIDLLKYESLQPGEEITQKVRIWDIQSSDSLNADYTVGSLLVRTNQGRIGVTDIIRGQFGNDTKKTIQDTAKRDGYSVIILIETGVAAAGDHLYKEWKDQLQGYRVHRAKAIKSKPDRATSLKNCILDSEFFLDLNDKKIIEAVNREMKSFPDGVHDDIVDTFAYGVIKLRRRTVLKPRRRRRKT